MKRPYIVGITGGSGAGKTFFLRELASCFLNHEVCLVSQDHYYRPRDQQPMDENGIQNFDLPVAIDRVALEADIQKLVLGEKVSRKEYTFNQSGKEPKLLEFIPAPILIVEGLFVQYFEEVSRLLDLRIFIEAKDHVKLGRRIQRDQIERGYDLDDVLYRYQNHVMPVYERLIEPLKQRADLIIPSNNNVSISARVIAGYLKGLRLP